MEPPPGEITQLLIELRNGSTEAEAKLIPLVYKELHNIAARYMAGERQDHTLQATALVHEAYMRLTACKEVNWRDRAHFFAFAASLMREILVDHARARNTAKRGSSLQELPLDEVLDLSDEGSKELLDLNDALVALEKLDRRKSRIVELRYFAGLTEDETAEALGISSRTVKREWAFARAWLFRELSGDPVE